MCDAVPRDGQMSDNPKHEQKIMIDRFLRVRDAAPGPTCCDRRGLTHSEWHDLSIEPARLNAGVRRGALRVEGR